jgi:NACHT domain
MSTFEPTNLEDDFIEAKQNWELEKLYIDLASCKGKALTPVEKKFLRGLLCGFSPAEIANVVYQSRSSSTVRVYLSNGLYKYIEEMLSIQAGYSVKVKNWSRVTQLLEKAGYKKSWLDLNSGNTTTTINIQQVNDFIDNKSVKKRDWGEAIDVSFFFGRVTELAQIQQWIVQDRCRLILILGMGGIGKTALSVKLAQEIHALHTPSKQGEFDCIVWRSLRLAPPPEVMFNELLQIFSQGKESISESIERTISQLVTCLRESRCLLVLDGLDAILCNSQEGGELGSTSTSSQEDTKNSGSIHSIHLLPQIRYRPGYEAYGELIRRLGESQHQSCLVLTTREKPQEISVLEGEQLPVRSLKLAGLRQSESSFILKAKGFADASESECKILVDCYGGNPLFLKLVATTIQELFGGDIHEFVEQRTVIFGDIRAILDQQFNRLSKLEKLIMYWLALKQDFVPLRNLQQEIIPRVSQRLILEAIDLLQRRSLLERQAFSFSPTPVLIEYITEKLIEENFQ